jgi:hypothetical protein
MRTRGHVAQLRDASELLLPEVRASVAALTTITDCDSAAVRLAERYAAAIDSAESEKAQAWVIRWVGPLLLDTLMQLGATPISRGVKAAAPEQGISRLDQLRAARR